VTPTGRRLLAGLAGAAFLLVGCGGNGEGGTLDRADEALAGLQQGEMSVSFTAQATAAESPSTAPVGFTLAGGFDLDAGTALPVLDMTYTRLLGDEREEFTVQSDGTRMVVTTDGVPLQVSPEQAAQLGLAEGERPGGLDDLGIAGWVTDPQESPGPVVDGVPTRRLAGPVDAGDLMSDLAILARQVSGQGGAAPLDDEAAARLQANVRSGDVEVLVDESDLPRRVRATVDFAPAAGPEVQRALGPYAGARLELMLEVREPGAPVPAPSLPTG
jgi:hypothetical protein